MVALVIDLGTSTWLLVLEKHARLEQARLRLDAEAARAHESRLLQQAKARELLSHAAALLSQKKIHELAKKTPAEKQKKIDQAMPIFFPVGAGVAARKAKPCPMFIRHDRLRGS